MTNWIEPVENAVAAMGGEPRALSMLLPEYRPELVLALADALGFRHCDFRREVMAKAGEHAADLPLSSVGATVRALHEDGGSQSGLVLQNVEALLGVVTPERRRAWFAEFVGSRQPMPVILPVVLHGGDVPVGPHRLDMSAYMLPQDSLMMRLWAAS
ncbi:MAG: hypothetical protein R3C97_12855 [Geminicoccaceae bacterium]